MFIKLRAEFAAGKAASGLEIAIPMPAEVSRLACDHASEVRILVMHRLQCPFAFIRHHLSSAENGRRSRSAAVQCLMMTALSPLLCLRCE